MEYVGLLGSVALLIWLALIAAVISFTNKFGKMLVKRLPGPTTIRSADKID